MAAAGLVDPTKAGRYPVVLSDALLGKKQGDVYTALRCKPALALSLSRAQPLRLLVADTLSC
jgi:hypothetical protein